LNVAGLGLSEIIPGTQEAPLRIAEETKSIPPPPIKTVPKFSIPKLNVTGLGLSEIIPGT
jgi:hypothetical protein